MLQFEVSQVPVQEPDPQIHMWQCLEVETLGVTGIG